MKTTIKITLFVVFFIAIAGIGIALYLFNKNHKDLQKVKPDFVITSSELQIAFESNETLSTAKFVNKILEVNGIIESVKPGSGNSLNIVLKTGSNLSTVICTFPKVNDPSIFKEGEQVTIIGECSGYLMDILLNNCVLKKTE